MMSEPKPSSFRLVRLKVKLDKLENFNNQYVEVFVQLHVFPPADPTIEHYQQLFHFETLKFE